VVCGKSAPFALQCFQCKPEHFSVGLLQLHGYLFKPRKRVGRGLDADLNVPAGGEPSTFLAWRGRRRRRLAGLPARKAVRLGDRIDDGRVNWILLVGRLGRKVAQTKRTDTGYGVGVVDMSGGLCVIECAQRFNNLLRERLRVGTSFVAVGSLFGPSWSSLTRTRKPP
jgi:hypothetical protein